MPRAASTFLLALLACSAHGGPSNGDPTDKAPPMTPTPPSTAKTTLEQIKRAYPRSNVGPTEITVPGVELFALSSDQPVVLDRTDMPTIVAVAGGVGSPILAGQDAMRAVIKATNDPMTLARVAMAIAKEDAELLTAPKNDQQQQEKVGPPVIEGNTLTFWIWTRGVGRELFMGKLDLTTGAYQRAVRQLSQDEQVERNIKLLASNNPAMERSGIESLAASCATNERARTAVLDVILHHAREATRIVAVETSPACGTAAVETLIHALEHDAARLVRGKAALALGEIGDRKAIPALEKAAKTDIASAANVALGKLK